MSQAFLRFQKLMAQIAALGHNVLPAMIAELMGKREFSSRGHGGKKRAHNASSGKSYRGSHNHYDFSSDRQHARHVRQGQHMATVNGFEIMQTKSSKARARSA